MVAPRAMEMAPVAESTGSPSFKPIGVFHGLPAANPQRWLCFTETDSPDQQLVRRLLWQVAGDSGDLRVRGQSVYVPDLLRVLGFEADPIPHGAVDEAHLAAMNKQIKDQAHGT